MKNSGLQLINVSLQVDDTVLVKGLNHVIESGKILTLMGPSGSGKSSLLALIAGVLSSRIDSTGQIVLNGRELGGLPTADRRVGLMFQDALLFPHMSVGENLSFALPAKLKGKARHAAVEEALVQAGMSGFYKRDPATLSGGQQSRVSLMRTLLAEPEALLLDEPYSRLDQSLRDSFRGYIQQLVQASQLPTLLVTHDVADAPVNGEVLQMADLVDGKM